MNSNQKYFFIGIGGIGMSSIAKYFLDKGNEIMGYDRVKSEIVENLSKEGFSLEHSGLANIDQPHIYHCGDIMYDNSVFLSQHPQCETDVLERNHLSKNEYILCTVHR